VCAWRKAYAPQRVTCRMAHALMPSYQLAPAYGQSRSRSAALSCWVGAKRSVCPGPPGPGASRLPQPRVAWTEPGPGSRRDRAPHASPSAAVKVRVAAALLLLPLAHGEKAAEGGRGNGESNRRALGARWSEQALV